jgi:antitoxin CptB
MRTSADLDPRRRRVLYRCWHRGMREVDILIGKFADAHIAVLDDGELDDLEALMEAPDRDIFAWLIGEHEVPAAFNTPLFRKLKQFHTHDRPINN